MTAKLSHPWCERNKGPILQVLQRVLPDSGQVLEIGSGSGQHAVHFSEHLAPLFWQPTDIDAKNLASIRQWRKDAGLPNLLEPLTLDVLSTEWGLETYSALFSANMIHIAPWECCLGLLAGARRHVNSGGLLALYGPFKIAGCHTADSNRKFDDNLRGKDSRWGVRDLDDVLAQARGFDFEERVEMPANNQVVLLRRQ